MRRPSKLSALVLVVIAVLAFPLRSDGGPECDNATTSLQSTINNPVAGDERFFTLPVGPSNVMFLLDVSGSMENIPQCGDATGWGSNALATCQWPAWASYNNPSVGQVAGNGTCDVSGNANLAWMSNYTPTPNLVDPGRGVAANGLADNPPWGTGCTGNGCLFQYDAIYAYDSDAVSSWTETSATPTPNPCTVSFTYTNFNCTTRVNETVTFTGTLPGCTACLANTAGKGFYFTRSWRAAYRTNNVSGGNCTGGTTLRYYDSATANRLYLTGGWLNANPPKFMSARKVIKDVAWIDPGVSATTDQLRLGLTYYSTALTNSARIIVPLGPSAADSYPPNSTAYVAARQLILDALNHTHGGLPGWPAGITPPSLINGGTPSASALFRVGQYFTQPGTYTAAFGSTYENSAFRENVAGVMQAPWVNNATNTICWSCQKSAVILVTDGSPNSEMTFPSAINSYQQNVYTNVSNCDTGTSCRYSPISKCCSPSDSTSNPPSRLPRVAAWLNNNDLSPSRHNGVQNVTVSTVSFGLPDPGAPAYNPAIVLLKATANMGKGMHDNASDGQALAASVAQAVNQVSTASTSFGAPAATALTTINAVDTKAFITRFRPNQKATWEGHLHQWMLFDEAAAGCDPTKQPDPDDETQKVICGRDNKEVLANFDGDTRDGYNLCSKSFLVDAECDEVVEDSTTGLWYKKGTGSPGTPATKFWDAGEVLSTPGVAGYRTAAEPADAGNIAPVTEYAPGRTPRNLWTALPNGMMYELATKNAATLAPYMNLDQAWCSSFESLARLCGAAPLPACPVTVAGNWQTYCAQQVILFARGWDVMDQDGDGCGGPGFGISPPAGYAPNPANGNGAGTNRVASGSATADCTITSHGAVRYGGEERDRQNDFGAYGATPNPSFWKLGDIFHSSPVLVHPPTSEIMCRLGVDNQCVRTLFGYTSSAQYADGYQTELDEYAGCTSTAGRVDAYRAWRSDYRNRQNVVLVGSNGGFLHAFDAGGQKTTASSHNKQDLDCVWPEVEDGTGEEIWGFTPPDLLPRLKDTLMNHQYMVDGNIMVRDIWVDDAPADASAGNTVPSTGNALDGVKQKNEFRTVVVFGERSGGMMFNALDVTNAFDRTAGARPRPTFRWRFPPPRSDDAQYMAQSWSDTSPRPPPIGAVRLVPTAADRDPQNKGWVEKWVIMLNGGYDPTLNRGRAVWTVDAWTGAVVWRFTDADFKRNVLGNVANTTTSMFPVAAGIGMVDIGDPSVGSGIDSDNFFDTATWGDLGGNLWVARFDQPGARDASGLATNWKAARAFEQGRRANDAQFATNRSEFFYMTSNAWEPQRRQLRTLLGSGNREQILEQGQGCGPDNLMSCCQAGCSVSTGTAVNYGSCSSTGSFACTSAGEMTSSPAFSQGCGASGAAACTGGATNTFTSTSSYTLTCTSGTSVAGGSIVCDVNGLCSVNPVGSGKDVVPPGAATCTNKAKFYGVWAYGGRGVPQKTFSTAPSANWSTAATFDQNRFTDVPNFRAAGICGFTDDGSCSLVETTQARVSSKGVLTCLDGSTRCAATPGDPGWFYTYNVTCPTQADDCSLGSCTFEKTASGSAVVNSCTTWNSFMPRGSALSGTDPCQGAQTAQQIAIGYSSDYLSGIPTLACRQAEDRDLDVSYRGAQRTTIAPPSAPMARNSVTKGGKVYYSTLQLDPGSAASTTGSGSRDIASPLYWSELTREDHMCRHQSSTACR